MQQKLAAATALAAARAPLPSSAPPPSVSSNNIGNQSVGLSSSGFTPAPIVGGLTLPAADTMVGTPVFNPM
jgi:hypothetical protein